MCSIGVVSLDSRKSNLIKSSDFTISEIVTGAEVSNWELIQKCFLIHLYR